MAIGAQSVNLNWRWAFHLANLLEGPCSRDQCLENVIWLIEVQIGAETSPHAYRQPVAVLAGMFFGYGVMCCRATKCQTSMKQLPFLSTTWFKHILFVLCGRIGETGQVRYATRVGRLCWGACNTKWKFIKHDPPLLVILCNFLLPPPPFIHPIPPLPTGTLANLMP